MTPDDLKKHYGNTQTAIAAALGVHQTTVLDWMRKGRIPYARQLWIQEKSGGALQADPHAWRDEVKVSA